VRSVVAHWGAAYGVVAVEAADPAKRDRYAYAASAALLPSVLEFNGLVDTTIPIQHALSIQANYDRPDINGRMSIVPLPHTPHGVFTENVTTPGAGLALTLPRAYCFTIAIIGHHRYRAESIRTGFGPRKI
jgi:hypothetical protein